MSDQVRWDERFGGEGYLFGTAPNAFLARQAPRLAAGQTALAIADGEGRNGVWLAERGLRVTSVDLSRVGQQKARRLARERGVDIRFELADILTWDWPEAAYDVIVGIFFQFVPPEHKARVFDGIRNAVKPGGLVLVEGYGVGQLAYGTGGPREAAQLYTAAELRTAFAGLIELEVKEYDADLAEGTHHVGLSALVDLAGRRPLESAG